MSPDVTTALGCACATTFVVGTVFAAGTALRHDTPAGRTWTGAFLSLGSVQLVALLREQAHTSTRLSEVAVTFGLVFVFGALWAGIRQFEDRPRLLRVPAVTAGAVAATALTDARIGDLELHTALGLLAISLFGLAAAVELRRGRMHQNLHARILQALLAGFAVLAPARGLYLAISGGRSDRSDAVAAVVLTSLFAGIAILLVALRTERTRSWWTSQVELTPRATFSVLTAEAFATDARDRIERSAATGTPIGLVSVRLTEIETVNAAFGRAAGDRAIVHVAEVLRTQVPPFAVIGHLGGGEFAVLTTARARRPVDRVRSAIVTGLTTRPWPEELPMPVPCLLGVAVATPEGATLETLLTDARRAASASVAT